MSIVGALDALAGTSRRLAEKGLGHGEHDWARAVIASELVVLRDRIEQLEAALVHVRSIIKDGAETGFNWKEGDWAERLYASQGVTHAALHPRNHRISEAK
jgi:hypothetical protein